METESGCLVASDRSPLRPFKPRKPELLHLGPSDITETLPLPLSGSWWAGYKGAWCSQSSGSSEAASFLLLGLLLG